MSNSRKAVWFLLLLLGLVAVVSFAAAQETPQAAEGRLKESQRLAVGSLAESAAVTQIQTNTAERAALNLPMAQLDLSPAAAEQQPSPTVVPAEGQHQDGALSGTASPSMRELPYATGAAKVDLSGRFVGLPQPAPTPSALGQTCSQLLGNPALDVSSGGSIAPWGVLEPRVYFSDVNFVSPQHSLLFEDNDADDPTPTFDAFAQPFSAPANLTEVVIEYSTASLDSNAADKAWGNIYSLDAGGNLDEFLLGWEVGESDGIWQTQTVTTNKAADLALLAGKDLVIIFFNDTTGSAPGEVVYFDDITLTACAEDKPDSFIIVRKQANPSSTSQQFTFDPSWSGSNFQLSHGQSKKSPALTPGTYAVEELVPSGWKLTSATCDDGSSPDSISLQAGETVTCTFRNTQEPQPDSCSQLLVNTPLNIVELGDGTGTAEPWTILIPIVWYTDDPGVAFDGYSLFLEDGDSGDPSPEIDMFGQGFQMPADPTQFSIEYKRATLDTNPTDEAYGWLWLLDDDWTLDFSKEENLVLEWAVNESEGVWSTDTGSWDDPALLNKLSGRKVAILFLNFTDSGAGKREIVLFDDISLTACTKSAPTSGRVLLPTIFNNFGTPSGPLCIPPSENPADQWNADRGLVEPGATCNSTLSNVDIADYYTLKPTKNGNYTLRLTNLPPGTEWSAMIWTDTSSPDFASGNGPDGDCRIGQSGAGDKQVVCILIGGKGYFVKVSAGSTKVYGQYTMRIIGP